MSVITVEITVDSCTCAFAAVKQFACLPKLQQKMFWGKPEKETETETETICLRSQYTGKNVHIITLV